MKKFMVSISEKDLNEIDKLSKKLGAKNKEEFLNSAMTLLQWYIEQQEKGRVVASIDEKAGLYREVNLNIK